MPQPVVDPREPGEKMGGNPLTRATSPNGRWAYTLYDGAGKTPFVHALDTRMRSARCIDLDALTGTNLPRMRLHLDAAAHTLTVNNGRRPVVVIDTRSFGTSSPCFQMEARRRRECRGARNCDRSAPPARPPPSSTTDAR